MATDALLVESLAPVIDGNYVAFLGHPIPSIDCVSHDIAEYPSYAYTFNGVSHIIDQSISRLHTERLGWGWATKSPSLYPSVPFILSFTGNLHLIWNAEVTFQANREARELINGEIVFRGRCILPICANDWSGIILVDSINSKVCRLTALSSIANCLDMCSNHARIYQTDGVLTEIRQIVAS